MSTPMYDEYAAGSAELVANKIAHATGVVYAPDVIAELLSFDPDFETFVDRLVAKPVAIGATTPQTEPLIERARRILDEYHEAMPLDVEKPGP